MQVGLNLVERLMNFSIRADNFSLRNRKGRTNEQVFDELRKWWQAQPEYQELTQLAAAMKERDEAREALEFYAKHENWSFYPSREETFSSSVIGKDWGIRARKALASQPPTEPEQAEEAG